MAVLASPAARAVRTACFAEQMQQKKQLLPASSQKSYPPAFHSLTGRHDTRYQSGQRAPNKPCIKVVESDQLALIHVSEVD
jgi:hypothetical protein